MVYKKKKNKQTKISRLIIFYWMIKKSHICEAIIFNNHLRNASFSQ